MITIRFPTGFSVQYNEANRVEYTGSVIRLTRKETGTWYADVPVSSGAIVENVHPCRTYNANAVDPGDLAAECLKNLRTFSGYKLAELKRALVGFDAKRGAWK